jgi:adenylate kinase family enzyme
MINLLNSTHKILIIGDSGRGKTTLAHKLSEKLKLPLYSTDDFFWKIKFSEPHNREQSVLKIRQIYSSNDWIMEGSSTHLFKPSLERADIIIILRFKNIFLQWWALAKRNIGRNNENSIDLIKFLIYVTRKKYNIGYKKSITNKKLLEPFTSKTIVLNSYKEIDDLLKELE